MGADQTVSGSEDTGGAVTATVVELLPRATFRLELEDRRQVLAHAAGARERNFVRVRVGDKVRVDLSPNDPTRGRITRHVSSTE